MVEQSIRSSEPMHNCICNAFNGRMRDEPLNETLFLSLDPAMGGDPAANC